MLLECKNLVPVRDSIHETNVYKSLQWQITPDSVCVFCLDVTPFIKRSPTSETSSVRPRYELGQLGEYSVLRTVRETSFVDLYV